MERSARCAEDGTRFSLPAAGFDAIHRTDPGGIVLQNVQRFGGPAQKFPCLEDVEPTEGPELVRVLQHDMAKVFSLPIDVRHEIPSLVEDRSIVGESPELLLESEERRRGELEQTLDRDDLIAFVIERLVDDGHPPSPMRRTTSYRSLPLHSGVPAVSADECDVRGPLSSLAVGVGFAESAATIPDYDLFCLEWGDAGCGAHFCRLSWGKRAAVPRPRSGAPRVRELQSGDGELLLLSVTPPDVVEAASCGRTQSEPKSGQVGGEGCAKVGAGDDGRGRDGLLHRLTSKQIREFMRARVDPRDADNFDVLTENVSWDVLVLIAARALLRLQGRGETVGAFERNARCTPGYPPRDDAGPR